MQLFPVVIRHFIYFRQLRYVPLNPFALVHKDKSLFFIIYIKNVMGKVIILGNHIIKNPNFPRYRRIEIVWHENNKTQYKKHEKIIIANPIFGYFFNLLKNAKIKIVKNNGLVRIEYFLLNSIK